MSQNDDILLKSFPDNVRSARGMYVGETTTPDKILSEITDNAFDEVPHGADSVSITTEGSHYVIADNGRGIPVRKVIVTNDTPIHLRNSSQADLSIGTLHSGSKFNKSVIKIGLNGVGSACCNALSTEYILLATLGNKHEKVAEMHEDLQKIYKNEDYHYVHYKLGIRQGLGFINLKDFEAKFGFKLPEFKFKPSTIVAFQPDPTMFDSTVANLPNTLKYVATMNQLLKRKLTVYINGEVADLHLGDFGSNIQGSILSSSTKPEEVERNPKFDIYASFGVNRNWGMRECTGSVNGLYTPRGLHIRAFTSAFSTAWTAYYGNANGVEFSSLNYWVIGLAQNPQFSSQTKVDCCTIQGINVSQNGTLVKAITKEFKNHPEIWDEYAAKVRTQIQNSKDLSRVDYIRSKIVIAAESKKANRFLPAKLKDCNTSKREDAELYICFTGDTKIRDCNLNEYTFKELTEKISKGEPVYTYSCDERGSLYPAKIIWAGITGKSNRMVRVTLDNGEQFECTPDHKIMLKDGSYKSAIEMSENDSCMPFYYELVDSGDYGGSKRIQVKSYPSDEYPFRWNYNTKQSDGSHYYWGYRIMSLHPDCKSDSSTGKKSIHHLDENPLNDYPNNLKRVDSIWHLNHHGGRALLRHYNKGEFNNFYGCNESKRQSIIRAQQEFWSSDRCEATRARLSDAASKQWSNPELLKWKAEDNRRWAKEHPIESSRRVSKMIDTKMRSIIYDVNAIIESKGLEKTFKNFNKFAYDRNPKKPFYAAALKRNYPDLMKDYVDDNFLRLRRYCESILNELKELNLPITKQNFSDREFLRSGMPVRIDTYRRYRKNYLDLFEKYESELNSNHKIMKIEIIEYPDPIEVYCLRVDNELHNFPLSAGIFAHNCEGASASGSILKARDPNLHAVLPLRGIPLNGVRLSLEEVLNNAELRDYISCIGLGVDEHYNLSKIRYGKVIICTDGDCDGFAIASSICATTVKHMRFLIEHGFLYVARAPLYEQDGKFFYDEEEFKLLDKKKKFIRFKGLGQMTPLQFKKAILDKNNRRLVKVTLEGAAEALRIVNSTGGRKDLMLECGVIKTSLYGEEVNA